MTVDQLSGLCVGNFPTSATRAMLMGRLIDVVTLLSAAGISGELWVDGSFLTEKIDPDDIDVVLRIPGVLYDKGTIAQRDAIAWFTSDLRGSHHIDSYFFAEYPVGHPEYWMGETMYAYWMRQWSFSRDMEMKGIAVILLPC